jgi:hypothetical protein
MGECAASSTSMLPQWSTGKELTWTESPLADITGLGLKQRPSSYINTAQRFSPMDFIDRSR